MHHTKSIQLSIIIPHYNSEASLIKLLQTVPAIDTIEIIIIDDNSTFSLQNLSAFIESCSFQHIYIYKNISEKKGAGASRNIGISHATGKWLLFADADDFFVNEWYQKIKDYMNSDWEMVYFCPTSQNMVTGQPTSRHVMYKELVENYAESYSHQAMLELKYCFCTPWSKLIRKEIIDRNQIRFDEVIVSNDIMFMTKCAFYSKRITADKNIIYCVTRGGSSLTAERDKLRFMTRIEVFINRYNFLREHLTKTDFNAIHMNRYALGKLADVIIENWGFSTFFELIRMFRKNHIRIWDVGLLNPFTLYHKVKIELAWWIDIKKTRLLTKGEK